MICEKHKVRKRKDCPDCVAESGTTFSEAPEKVSKAVAKVSIEEPVKLQHYVHVKAPTPELEITIEDLKEAIEPVANVKRDKFDEKEYIQVLVEKELKNSLLKLKSELNELKRIDWEHLHVPLGTFSLKLLFALEKEGWKYCEMVRDGKRFGYAEEGEFVIVQRVKRSGAVPKPDFNKRGTLKKYLEED